MNGFDVLHLHKDPEKRFGQFSILEDLNRDFAYFKPLNWQIVRNRRLRMPSVLMPKKDDKFEEYESSIENEDINIPGDHFRGFSFYNDFYEFEEDLSFI